MVKLKINTSRYSKLAGIILDQFTLHRWIVPLILIVVYFVVYSVLFPRSFLSAYNLSSMALEFAIPLSFVTVGMAIMLINGEIDLSVGYAVMFSNMVTGFLVINRLPLVLCIVTPIVVTGLIGYIVGLLVARVGVNSFIATLGSGLVFYGLGLIIYEMCRTFDGGMAVQHLEPWFIRISQAKLITFPDTGAIQIPVFYSAVLILMAVILTSKFRYFRKFYYIGVNREAALLSGINVKSMKAISFIISSALAGAAGMLMCARMGAAVPLMGTGFELKAITACVIGGVSFSGGKGTIGGAILGGLFMICLSNGLRIAYAPSNIYRLIEGSILLIAVIADAMMSKRKVIG
jgi:ribose/xylose/arabinose/galactoside ABC-type transport system permease subunit